jgi:L-ascorbate 6-phosphate lactonase
VLADAIRNGRPETGVVAWWLGQAGFVFRSADATVVVDPFLTNFGDFGRTYPPPLSPAELPDTDVLLCTHDHADHIDPEGVPLLLEAAPHARLVLPAAVAAPVCERLGLDRARATGIEAGERVDVAGVMIEAIAALHGDVPADGYGFHRDPHGRHPFLGYVLELAGVRIAHLGDTLVYDGLAETLRDAALDVLILPINGRSFFREQRDLVGNMNAFEAAELAELAAARLTVPVHWDLFADNAEDPDHFVRYAARRHPSVTTHVPAIGQALAVRPWL